MVTEIDVDRKSKGDVEIVAEREEGVYLFMQVCGLYDIYVDIVT